MEGVINSDNGIGQVASLIKREIDKHICDPLYYGSIQAEESERLIYESLLVIGYDYESDAETCEYCLKATIIEQWQYYLTNVIPNIN